MTSEKEGYYILMKDYENKHVCFCGRTDSTARAKEFPPRYLQWPRKALHRNKNLWNVRNAPDRTSFLKKKHQQSPEAKHFWFLKTETSKLNGNSLECVGEDIFTACLLRSRRKHFLNFVVVGIVFFLKTGTFQTAVVIVLCEGHLNKPPSALQVQPNILVMARIIMEVNMDCDVPVMQLMIPLFAFSQRSSPS